jgi:hypothetical protein
LSVLRNYVPNAGDVKATEYDLLNFPTVKNTLTSRNKSVSLDNPRLLGAISNKLASQIAFEKTETRSENSGLSAKNWDI